MTTRKLKKLIKSEVEKIYNKLYTSSNLFMERKRTKFNEIMATSR